MEKFLSSYRSLLLLTIFFTAGNTTSENYYTGLRVYKDFDKNRKFDTTSNDKAPFYFRPVKIDLFYPLLLKQMAVK